MGLESKLMELSKESNNIESLLNKALPTLSCLDELYEKANNKTKREIIGSIFPHKLVFDGMHYRTARLNEAVALIYNVGTDLALWKMKKKTKILVVQFSYPT